MRTNYRRRLAAVVAAVALLGTVAVATPAEAAVSTQAAAGASFVNGI